MSFNYAAAAADLKAQKRRDANHWRLPITDLTIGRDVCKETTDTATDCQHAPIRTFASGATRDTDEGKPEYGGFLSPLVIEAYGAYMTRHRFQADGNLRASDNWKKGIPKSEYVSSLLRHVMDLWLEHDGYKSRDGIEDALCGVMFNAMGYLHEVLKERV